MSILSGMGASANPITGTLTSVVEGIGDLGAAVGHAAEGDWAAAGQDFAGVAMEAAGIAGTALGFPASETVFEGLESVLTETGVLDEGGAGADGLIPPPGGGTSGAGSAGGGPAGIAGMLGTSLPGAFGGSGGAASLGPLGGAGAVLSQFGGGGGDGAPAGGGGIASVLTSSFGGAEGGELVNSLSSIGQGMGLMTNLQDGASAVGDDLVSSFLGSING